MILRAYYQYMLTILVVWAAAMAFTLANPTRTSLFVEDGVIEMATALAFFAAFLASIFYLFRGGHNRFSALLVGGIALLGALDEMSFGERHFDVQAPHVLDHKIDGAHDFLSLVNGLMNKSLPGDAVNLLLLMLGFAGMWLAWVVLKRLKTLTLPSIAIVMAASGSVILAQLLDAKNRLGPFEELLELSGGMLLVCFFHFLWMQFQSGAAPDKGISDASAEKG